MIRALASSLLLLASTASAQWHPATTDADVSPRGYYSWACHWEMQPGTASVEVVSGIAGITPQCVDLTLPGARDITVGVPLDQLHQDLSTGYRLRAHSLEGCTGEVSSPSPLACRPVPEPSPLVGLVAGAGLLWALGR